jgi:hypothetical protein
MWTKKETQQTIKELRKVGYIIEKRNGIYKIIDEDGEPWVDIEGKPLFSAMLGMRGYLVNFNASQLLQENSAGDDLSIRPAPPEFTTLS